MKYFFVAKTPTSGFVGQMRIEDIAAKLKSKELRDDFYAAEASGVSYVELVKSGKATWIPISKLLRETQIVSSPTIATARTSAGLTDPIEMRSGWAVALRILGGFNLFIGAIAFVLNVDSYVGVTILAICVVGAIQSFFFAFLVDVFTDIRWFVREIASERREKK